MKPAIANAFTTGDIVKLKSNGQIMKVTVKRRAFEYDHHYGLTLTGKAVKAQKVYCAWEEKGVVKEASFDDSLLERVG